MPTALRRTVTEPSASAAYIPRVIWEGEWVGQTTSASIDEVPATIEELRAVMQRSPMSDRTPINIEGQTMPELVAGLKDLLRRCVQRSDFTDVINKPVQFRM